MCGRFVEILKTPLTAIKKAKREKNINKTVGILVVTWILFGISFFILAIKTYTPLVSLGMSLSIFLLGLLCNLFCGYLTTVVINVLGGRGKYYHGLTAATYTLYPLSIGFIITALLSLIHPALSLIGFIVIAVKAALGFSIYFRSVKEFFNTNMLIALIGFLILIYVFIVAMYVTVLFNVQPLTMFSNFSSSIGT